MIKHILHGIIFSITLLVLTGCGGGGSGTAVIANNYTTATVKVALSGDLGGKAIAGAEFTMTLPDNVTPEMVNGAVASSVVTPSGTFEGSSIAPIITYVPANGADKGTVKMVVASSAEAGVTTVGEVATVTLQLANGVTPAAANFKLDSVPVKVIDTVGNQVEGMSVTVSGVTLK